MAQFPDEQTKSGSFKRQEDAFREWVKRDGSSPYKPERGRYHLYVSYACPWAHRTIILRKLKGLEEAITDIGKDLNSQYVLSYSPNNKEEPGFHNIKVSVDRPGLIVRTRPGYWWGGGQIQ